MAINEDELFQEMLERPDYFGISVYRRNPCCYGDKIEAQVGTSFEHQDDARDMLAKLRAAARTVEALIERFETTGEIETMMGACVGCEEVSV